MMRDVGTQSGRYEFSEGRILHLHLGLGPEDFDPLADLNKESC